MRTLHYNNINTTTVLYDWDKLIGENWEKALNSLIEENYCDDLVNFIEQIYLSDKEVFPVKSKIFRPFRTCSLKELKAVIIDDRPVKSNKSSGLGRGCDVITELNTVLPKELMELKDCIYSTIFGGQFSTFNFDDSLKELADNGILFLNSSMTVTKDDDHKIIWRNFIRTVIKTINNEKNNVVFLFLTDNNSDLYNLIDKKKHGIIINKSDTIDKNSDIFMQVDRYVCKNYKTNDLILW